MFQKSLVNNNNIVLFTLNFPLCFRMLVVIVSLGFGIVKPRLGPTLHKVVGIGGLYFAVASVDAYLREVLEKQLKEHEIIL